MFLVLFCFISVKISEIQLECDRRTDGPINGCTKGPTNRRTDIPSYRDARTHLIKGEKVEKGENGEKVEVEEEDEEEEEEAEEEKEERGEKEEGEKERVKEPKKTACIYHAT